MAVPAVWRLINVLEFIEPNSTPKHTGETPVLPSKNLKATRFWYKLSLWATKVF